MQQSPNSVTPLAMFLVTVVAEASIRLSAVDEIMAVNRGRMTTIRPHAINCDTYRHTVILHFTLNLRLYHSWLQKYAFTCVANEDERRFISLEISNGEKNYVKRGLPIKYVLAWHMRFEWQSYRQMAKISVPALWSDMWNCIVGSFIYRANVFLARQNSGCVLRVCVAGFRQ